MSGRRRPGRLWLLFWGKKRRGFPGLLVSLLVAIGILGAVFGLPHGADLSAYSVFFVLTVLALLILAALGLVVVGLLRPPRRHRR